MSALEVVGDAREADTVQLLAAFVQQAARDTAAEVGFEWVGSLRAPSTYQQVRAAFERSLRTGEPFPVSDEHCESTIYPQAEDNVAFRFWHDVHHVRRGLSFGMEDELELAVWHLQQLTVAGYPAGHPVHELLSADLFGQVVITGIAGRFPIDQRAFVQDCTEQGLAAGLLREVRRVP